MHDKNVGHEEPFHTAESVGIEVSDEDVRRFQLNGFLSLGQMSTHFEVTWLKYIHDTVIEMATGFTPVELQDVPPGELSKLPVRGGNVHESLITIVAPEKFAPDLNQALVLNNVRQVFTRLLDVAEERLRLGWRIFCKLGHGSETPWHQDAAYRPPPYTGASIWMPLDPATQETSCLSYIGGSHLGDFRPHSFHDDHMIAEDVDASHAVSCPGAVGEAIAHHCLTLHSAGPNTSDRPRRAFTVVCRVIS